MSGTIQTERRYAGGFIVSEVGQRSRDAATITNTGGSAVTHSAGTVMAQRRLGAMAGAKASGTGDGTISAVTGGKATQIGTYVLTCTATAANGGTFSVMAPDGTRLKDLAVGVAYDTDHIDLTVADGATDWGVGAVINVTVAAGDKGWVPFTNAADQTVLGILFDRVTVPATGTAPGVIFAREGEVNAAELVFDPSLSGTPLTNAKAAAATLLAAAGIIQR